MATPLDAGSRLKAILRGSAGNLVEYYDWYVYTAFSLYFASVFFPKGDQTAQLLSTAAVFAVGFLMRPIGALFFGMYADRAGRRASLVFSVTLMCAGSLLVAITPGYETIGVFAPAILLIARLLQGLSLGGEYGTSSTYLSEIASSEHRGFWVSFQYVSLVIGQLLALCMLLLLQHVFLTEAELQSWGWRIPFLVGAACAAYALYLRRHMPETDSFEKQTTAKRMQGSVRELFRHPR